MIKPKCKLVKEDSMKLHYLHFLKRQKMYCIYCGKKVVQPLLNEYPGKEWTQIPRFRQRLYWLIRKHVREEHPQHCNKLK